MKATTLIAVVAAVAGAGAIGYGSASFAASDYATPVRYAGVGLLALAAIALAMSIGSDVLFGQGVIPAAAAAIAVAGHITMQASPFAETVRVAFAASPDELTLQLEIFSGTVSTIYALLAAFMVFNAMQDHNSINAALQDEAIHLDSISLIVPHLHDAGSANAAAGRRIHQLLLSYTENVLTRKFSLKGYVTANQQVIDSVIDEIYRLRVADDSDRVSLDALVGRVDQLATLRAHRIAYMNSRPSPLMVTLLFLLSILVVVPFYLPTDGGAFVSQMFVGALAFCLTFIFSVLIDMSSHFSGYWQVDRAPFVESKERITARLVAHDAKQAAAA